MRIALNLFWQFIFTFISVTAFGWYILVAGIIMGIAAGIVIVYCQDKENDAIFQEIRNHTSNFKTESNES